MDRSVIYFTCTVVVVLVLELYCLMISDVSSRTCPRPRGALRTKSSGLGLGLGLDDKVLDNITADDQLYLWLLLAGEHLLH